MSSGVKKMLSTPVIKNQSSKPKKAMIQGPSTKHSTVQYRSAKGGLKENGIENRLKKSSPWYASIKDPLQGAGAKIPDAVGVSTGTYQITQSVSVAVNAQGVAGCRIFCPYPNGGATSANGRNFQTTSADGNTSNIWLNATAQTLPFSGYSGITPSLVRGSRVVSAGIFAEYEGTTLSDSGDLTCYQTPMSTSAENTTLATYQSYFNNAIVPINRSRNSPTQSLWYPVTTGASIANSMDGTQLIPILRDYTAFYTATGTALAGTQNAAAPPNWELGIVATGLPASTGSVRFKMVVNLEILPNTNAAQFFGAQNSPIDRAEEDKVVEWVQNDTLVGLAKAAKVDVPASSSAVDKAQQQRDSSPVGDFMGMAGNILMESLPLLLALI